MARLPRLTIPGYPHLVLLTGNDARAVFADDEDRDAWLARLRAALGPCRARLHAYVLLPSQVRLLLTPEDADSLPRLIQAIGRDYVRYFNRRHGRSGTLWEGRYRATVLQPDRHVLVCMALMDARPVAEGLAARAADYPWSSHAHYAGLRSDLSLTPPSAYWALGDTPFAREAAYAAHAETGVTEAQAQAIERAGRGGWALGDAAFLAQLQRQTRRRIAPARAGRPRKRDIKARAVTAAPAPP
ncbi:MAG: transposase [Burkholderiaceae bacterium]|jgi:putative transposase|nr:transposase [Burkholderiaceae bacterium]